MQGDVVQAMELANDLDPTILDRDRYASLRRQAGVFVSAYRSQVDLTHTQVHVRYPFSSDVARAGKQTP